MNRAFLLVLGPTAMVAAGYVLVLRAIGMEPPYWKLAAVIVMLGLALLWIGKRHKKNQEVK